MATIIIGIFLLGLFVCAGYYTYKSQKSDSPCGKCSGCPKSGECRK